MGQEPLVVFLEDQLDQYSQNEYLAKFMDFEDVVRKVHEIGNIDVFSIKAEKNAMEDFRMDDYEVREAFDDIMNRPRNFQWLSDHQRHMILMDRDARDAEEIEWQTDHDVETQAHVQPETDLEAQRQAENELKSDPDLFY